MIGIEPLALQRGDLVVHVEVGVGVVEKVQQMLVVRHELILAVWHVHRCEHHIIDMIMLYQPFQRERVPHDHAPFLLVHLLDRLSHVVAHDGMRVPAVVVHQVITEARVVDEHSHARLVQVAEGLDLYGLALRRHHALGEQGDGIATVQAVLVVESCCQTEREVCLSCLQVVEHLLLVFQLDDIGNVQLVHQQADEVDVIALGLAFVVDERIGPKVPGVLIHKGILLGIGLYAFRLGGR